MISPRPGQPTPQIPIRKNAWFAREQITATVSRIWEPAVESLLQANIWHITGSRRDLVVDAGLGIGSLRNEQPSLFMNDPLLVLTHAHLDHSGGAHEFDQIAMAELELGMLDECYSGGLAAEPLGKALGLHHSALLSTDNGLMVKEVPARDYSPTQYRLQSFEPSVFPRDGDRIDIGDSEFTAMHLPGHSPGSLALFEADRGWLFSGDVLYDGLLLDDLRGSDADAYRASLQRIRQANPEIVFPGHGPPLNRDTWQRVISRYLDRPAS